MDKDNSTRRAWKHLKHGRLLCAPKTSLQYWRTGDVPLDAAQHKREQDEQVQFMEAYKALENALSAENEGGASDHPEDTCEDCGRDNVVWFTPSDLWNAVCRPQGYQSDPMLCPVCFIRRAEALGIVPTAWRVIPEVGG